MPIGEHHVLSLEMRKLIFEFSIRIGTLKLYVSGILRNEVEYNILNIVSSTVPLHPGHVHEPAEFVGVYVRSSSWSVDIFADPTCLRRAKEVFGSGF